jgi:glucose-1-phosphate adenylyltransferase
MADFHGIIFAYSAAPEMGELVRTRTSSSLPFCGRYRLIDFALSSMQNAGIRDVGVIMQRDYQSLLDHLGSGKDWDMSRRRGGLRMLPPFGLPEYHTGEYIGTIEALNAVSTYIHDIPQKHVVIMRGSLAANLDLDAAIQQHLSSGAELTAVCAPGAPSETHHRFVPDADGFSSKMLFTRTGGGEGAASLEVYIIEKELLVKMMESCAAENKRHYHRDAIAGYLQHGGRIGIYMHDGYAAAITTVADYFRANMDMLQADKRAAMFPPSRPVRTKNHEEVSTYYGEEACACNSLVADGCIIEGTVNNSILFSDVRVAPGAVLDGCIVMRGGVIGENAQLKNVIADKYAELSPYITLTGSPRLPIVVPKSSKI